MTKQKSRKIFPLSREEKLTAISITGKESLSLLKTLARSLGNALSGNPVGTLLFVGGVTGLLAYLRLLFLARNENTTIPPFATVKDLTLEQINHLRTLAGA